jgi:hypothetical protein
VTYHFGPGKDHPPKDPDILPKVCQAFGGEGVTVRPEWFDLTTEEFQKLVDPPDQPPGDWVIDEADNHDANLSELHLHPPAPTNMPGVYYLSITLLFGLTDSENHSIMIGLKEADLVFETTNCQLAHIDDDAAGNASWKRVPGGAVRFTAPAEPGYLDGAPLGQQKLLKIEHVGPPQKCEAVKAIVRFPLLSFRESRTGSLAPVAATPDGSQLPVPAKEVDGPAQAALNAFFQKLLRMQNETKRPILSSATLSRRGRRDAKDL